MRNWNRICEIRANEPAGIYNTYEELKLKSLTGVSVSKSRIYNTYEELKLFPPYTAGVTSIGIYNTYEELKQVPVGGDSYDAADL